MTEERVTPLRQRMTEDMCIRGLDDKAQRASGTRPGPVRTAGPRVPTFQLCRHLSAPTARVEPTGRCPLPGRPVWVAARPADRRVHLGEESGRLAAHARGLRGTVPGFPGAAAEFILIAGRGETIGATLKPLKEHLRVSAVKRAKKSCGMKRRNHTLPWRGGTL